jgi:hypothetical protein
MITRILAGRALAAVAGAAMLAATATSASAFTLSSPSLESSVAGSNIEHVYWDHWHHWHGVWGGPGVRFGVVRDQAGIVIAGAARSATCIAIDV